MQARGAFLAEITSSDTALLCALRPGAHRPATLREANAIVDSLDWAEVLPGTVPAPVPPVALPPATGDTPSAASPAAASAATPSGVLTTDRSQDSEAVASAVAEPPLAGLPALSYWRVEFCLPQDPSSGDAKVAPATVDEHLVLAVPAANSALQLVQVGSDTADWATTRHRVIGQGFNEFGGFTIDGTIDTATMTLTAEKVYTERVDYRSRKTKALWDLVAAAGQSAKRGRGDASDTDDENDGDGDGAVQGRQRGHDDGGSSEDGDRCGEDVDDDEDTGGGDRSRGASRRGGGPSSSSRGASAPGNAGRGRRQGSAAATLSSSSSGAGPAEEVLLPSHRVRPALPEAQVPEAATTGVWVRASVLDARAGGGLDGAVYEGALVGGVPHGAGTLVFQNAHMLEGSFERGAPHGWCVVSDAADRTVFEGEVMRGAVTGFGRATLPGGDRYEGHWKEGRFHGKGKLSLRRGGFYDGDWVMGVRHGHGHQVSACGVSYVGAFVDGKRSGQGKAVTADGDEYVGTFDDDYAHGKGEMRWRTGETHKGDFARGRRCGKGAQTMPAGAARLSGKWARDLPAGTMELDAPAPLGMRHGEWAVEVAEQ